MTLLMGIYLTTFLAGMVVGFAVGYGLRAVISSRRRAQARRRYDTTGSYERLA
jgi:hypothetical protein